MNSKPQFATRQMLGTAVLAVLLMTAVPAFAQEGESTFAGTVASTSRNTLTVRSSSGRYQSFVYDRGTAKPAAIPIGSQVRVTWTAGDDPDVRVASEVTITSGPTTTQAETTAPVVPPEVRRLERDIERQARRYQLGVRAGVALDPELIMIGVQAQVGPFFGDNIYFRPNVEFAFGEVTALFGLNPEIVYRLPLSSRQARWSTYFGIGPGFNFLHQNFQSSAGGKRIDFGQFHSDTGLNILGGVRYRSGMFAELKTTVYSEPAPTLRLIVGYNF
jgi:opacity protein-like surface antigen